MGLARFQDSFADFHWPTRWISPASASAAGCVKTKGRCAMSSGFSRRGSGMLSGHENLSRSGLKNVTARARHGLLRETQAKDADLS
jgi:hypothetical protein